MAAAQRTYVHRGSAACLALQSGNPGSGGVDDQRGPYGKCLLAEIVLQLQATDTAGFPDERQGADIVETESPVLPGLLQQTQDQAGIVGHRILKQAAAGQVRLTQFRCPERQFVAGQMTVAGCPGHMVIEP